MPKDISNEYEIGDLVVEVIVKDRRHGIIRRFNGVAKNVMFEVSNGIVDLPDIKAPRFLLMIQPTPSMHIEFSDLKLNQKKDRRIIRKRGARS